MRSRPERVRRPPPALARIWRQLGIPLDYPAARGLPVHREARKLERIARRPTRREVKLTPPAAAAWRRMHAAATADQVELVPVSGFRSVTRQTRIIRRKLAEGDDIAAILRYVAAPGCSEHHTGRALDLGTPGATALTTAFARTRAFRWLRRHAGRFGFTLSYPPRNPHGIGYEPWHWCWRRSPPGRR